MGLPAYLQHHEDLHLGTSPPRRQLLRAQTEAWCRCSLFVSSENAEIMVYELPEVAIDSCEDHNQCKKRCTNEVNTMTNNMDLWSTFNGGDETVGQVICQNLNDNFIFFIHNTKVHANYELCGGACEFTGQDSQQMLCCSGGQHEHCISK